MRPALRLFLLSLHLELNAYSCSGVGNFMIVGATDDDDDDKVYDHEAAVVSFHQNVFTAQLYLASAIGRLHFLLIKDAVYCKLSRHIVELTSSCPFS